MGTKHALCRGKVLCVVLVVTLLQDSGPAKRVDTVRSFSHPTAENDQEQCPPVCSTMALMSDEDRASACIVGDELVENSFFRIRKRSMYLYK